MNELSQNELIEKITSRLRINGPTSSSELQQVTSLSQPQLSRYLKKLKNQIIRMGKGKNTRYAYLREFPQVGSEVSIYQVKENGEYKKTGTLYPIMPKGFYWEAEDAKQSRFFDDLPYFLNDLRPAGFLGRIIPRTYPDWEFPENIQLWNAEATLRYLTNFGVDLIGDLIVGDKAVQKFISSTFQIIETNTVTNEVELYEELARGVEKYGLPGSSAGGEHPKFLTIRLSDNTQVIVKFVLNAQNPKTERRLDLLRAESIASSILSTPATIAPTRIIEGRLYTFLEIVRFDRVRPHGRKGVISLLSLDAEFIGSGASWSIVGKKLLDKEIITRDIADEIEFREYFGSFIGNTDMHSGNMSLFFEEEKVKGITPVYDMLPMMYAPRQEYIDTGVITISPPKPQTITLWKKALELAVGYWQRIQITEGFSASFIEIARNNVDILQSITKS